MSQENAGRLRALCEAWGRREEADLSLLHRDVVFEESVLPDQATYRGRDAVIRATRNWLVVYESFSFGLEQLVGSGDRLVTIHRFRGKGRRSGIEDDARFAYLWTFRNDKVVHFISFRDPADALEAAGLATEPRSQEEIEQSRRQEAELRRSFEAELRATDTDRRRFF